MSHLSKNDKNENSRPSRRDARNWKPGHPLMRFEPSRFPPFREDPPSISRLSCRLAANDELSTCRYARADCRLTALTGLAMGLRPPAADRPRYVRERGSLEDGRRVRAADPRRTGHGRTLAPNNCIPSAARVTDKRVCTRTGAARPARDSRQVLAIMRCNYGRPIAWSWSIIR